MTRLLIFLLLAACPVGSDTVTLSAELRVRHAALVIAVNLGVAQNLADARRLIDARKAFDHSNRGRTVADLEKLINGNCPGRSDDLRKY